ncbi:hypothetical protein [Paraburkholderia sp. J67]|uniref:hypothetical protein n=1 Tax=Paraburkholderia sp. J67 TaxID=2805435 RepID=UPI002ABD4B0B|nr:hypothetical protein [Paraburkholderia sp. J67]
MPDFSDLTEEQEKTFRAQAWSYFALHAGQRMQTFQFYVTLITALVGGAIVLAKEDFGRIGLEAIGAVITLMSYVFWKLDCRIRTLIKNAEGALKFLDHFHALPVVNGAPHPLDMFARDDALRQRRTGLMKFVSGDLSYSNCFNLVYVTFGCGGAIFGGAVLLSHWLK